MNVNLLGAMNAMQDAVVLVNCLYDLEDLSSGSLTAAFEDYKSQRYKEAKKQVAYSKLNARISSGQVQYNIQRWDSYYVLFFLLVDVAVCLWFFLNPDISIFSYEPFYA